MTPEEIVEWTARNDKIKSNILSQVSMLDGMLENMLSFRFSFNEEDKKKFHKIFFSGFVSFNQKITLFRNYLKEYYPQFLRDGKLKEFYSYLDLFRDNRNLFAHSINPMKELLESKDKDDMPHVLLNKYRNGELEPIEFTEDDILEIEKKLGVLKTMFAVLQNYVIVDVEKLKSDICTDIDNTKRNTIGKKQGEK